MKKQIITIVAVALAAILVLIPVFMLDNGNKDINVQDDPYTTVSNELRSAIEAIEGDVKIELLQYNGANSEWEKVYLCAETIADINQSITFTESKNGNFSGVTVTADGKTTQIPFADMFLMNYKTPYGFRGYSVILNAIFKLKGMPEIEIDPIIYDGYNSDGNVMLDNEKVFVFPALERNQIAFLTVTNDYGEYSLYQDKGEFYFSSSRAASYDSEGFAQLTTNCRYPVAYGAIDIPNGKTFADYGLTVWADKESTLDQAPEGDRISVSDNTVEYTVITTNDADGNYAVHTVVINKTVAASGVYHYGRYIGGIFTPATKEGEADKIVQNISSDKVYFIPAETVQSLLLPETDFMVPNLIANKLTNIEELYNIGDIRIDYLSQNLHAAAKNITSYFGAANLAAFDSYGLSKVIWDKKIVTDYSTYAKSEQGWLNHTTVFAGFTSSDGKATSLIGSLARIAKNGEYKIEFGLLRDEAMGAYLPANISIEKSYDGINWHSVEGGVVYPDQKDKSMGRYSISFNDPDPVTFVRLNFGVPQKQYTYVVFDEIRIYADGLDAQPSNVMSTRWKLVSPESYIHTGYNYANLDMQNFNDFVQSLAALESGRVVACGFSDNSDASNGKLNTEILAKYGLAEPAKHFSYEYKDILTDLYISAPDENGNYYAYSTFTGDVNGETKTLTTDVIVQLTVKDAAWLGWEFTEFIDHSLVALYVVDIDSIDITLNGTTHSFTVITDAEGANITDVAYNGKSCSVEGLQDLYYSIVMVSMQDKYDNAVENAEEYLRIKINSLSDNPEIVFYKISATRCYYTINGEGGYYVHADSVKEIITKLQAYIA